MDTQNRTQPANLGSLRAAAQVAIVMAWLVGVVGFFGGLGVGLSSSDEYWNVAAGVGVAVAVGSFVVAAVLGVLGYWAAAWARQR